MLLGQKKNLELIWRIVPSSSCCLCDIVSETRDHLLLECEVSKKSGIWFFRRQATEHWDSIGYVSEKSGMLSLTGFHWGTHAPELLSSLLHMLHLQYLDQKKQGQKIIDMTIGDITMGKRKRIPFIYLIKYSYKCISINSFLSCFFL